ncbi:MAG: hypothetical protein CMJ33_08610 [Phycisphaerae bacterium]|nr:hypothetical protein [Phycisphaerae bacterium]
MTPPVRTYLQRRIQSQSDGVDFEFHRFQRFRARRTDRMDTLHSDPGTIRSVIEEMTPDEIE